MTQEVGAATSGDAFLLPNLATDADSCKKVDQRYELGAAAQAAAVSHGLGVLPKGIAGAEPGDDAQSAVIEAAA